MVTSISYMIDVLDNINIFKYIDFDLRDLGDYMQKIFKITSNTFGQSHLCNLSSYGYREFVICLGAYM